MKAQGKRRGIAFASLEQEAQRREMQASHDGADLGTVSLSLTQISKPDLLSLQNGVHPGFSYSRYTIYSSPARSNLTLVFFLPSSHQAARLASESF